MIGRTVLLLGVLALAAGCSAAPAVHPRPHEHPHRTPLPRRVIERVTSSPTRARKHRNVPAAARCQIPAATTRVGRERVYEVVTCDSGASAFVRSKNAGHSWARAIPLPGLTTYDNNGVTLAFSSRRVGFVLDGGAGYRGRLYLTRDGGRSWRHAPVARASGLAAAGARVYVYDRHRIYSSEPNGRLRFVGHAPGPAMGDIDGTVYAYRPVSRGRRSGRYVAAVTGAGTSALRLPCRQAYDYATALTGLPDGDLVAVCAGEPGSGNQLHRGYRSTDAGRSWRRSASPPQAGYIAADGALAVHGAFVGESDGGLLVEHRPDAPWRVAPFEVDGIQDVGFVAGTYGWATADDGRRAVRLTDDGGRRWRRATRP